MLNNKHNINTDVFKNILFSKIEYKENKENYKVFKNMFIRKNLITKDYNDLKEIFLKFIPGLFLDEVGVTGTEKISLGLSVKKKLHIMFLDIIGFTTISEKIKPERVLLLLNIYFDGIVEIIRSNGGYIDKFLGDGIMVIFDSKSSDSSIKASLEIQDFIKKFNFSEIGKCINIGIGINTGEVIMGTIGSKDRMEITAIGDTVNTAARLEGLTRKLKHYILISESTFNNLKNKQYLDLTDLGYREVKGKQKTIKIYGVNKI